VYTGRTVTSVYVNGGCTGREVTDVARLPGRAATCPWLAAVRSAGGKFAAISRVGMTVRDAFSNGCCVGDLREMSRLHRPQNMPPPTDARSARRRWETASTPVRTSQGDYVHEDREKRHTISISQLRMGSSELQLAEVPPVIEQSNWLSTWLLARQHISGSHDVHVTGTCRRTPSSVSIIPFKCGLFNA
jgi:hypothetical protein